MAHRYEDYPPTDELPWLDRPDAQEAVERRRAAGELTDEQASKLTTFARDGFLELEDLLDPDTASEINADVQAILDANRHLPIAELKLKFQDIFPGSAATRRAMCTPALLEWLDLILDRRALPYQTLNLPVSSQQGAHSDAILMTTHPPGYLIAAWFALEDVTPDCGPVYVLPGSHRLPYLSAAEVGIPRGATEAECGQVYDANYYKLIGERAAASGIEPHTYLGKRGDVLIWHSNLLHGAHGCTRAGATRRSLIVHYFGQGAEVYSDLFQRPCNLPGLR